MKRFFMIFVFAALLAGDTWASEEENMQELFDRSLKGVQNQRAWVATIEKQLANEKNNLSVLESEHERRFGKAKAAQPAVKKVPAKSKDEVPAA